MREHDLDDHGKRNETPELHVPNRRHLLVLACQEALRILLAWDDLLVVRDDDKEQAQVEELHDADSSDTVLDGVV